MVFGSVFEPHGDDPFACVNIHPPRLSCPGVHELVGHAGRHYHDLPAPRLYLLVSGREGDVALLHHEDFLVGVPVQPRAAVRLRICNDEGDGGKVLNGMRPPAKPAGALQLAWAETKKAGKTPAQE